MKQVMLYFGDIKPFLDANEDIGPVSRPNLLAFSSDPLKLAMLHKQNLQPQLTGGILRQSMLLSRR